MQNLTHSRYSKCLPITVAHFISKCLQGEYFKFHLLAQELLLFVNVVLAALSTPLLQEFWNWWVIREKVSHSCGWGEELFHVPSFFGGALWFTKLLKTDACIVSKSHPPQECIPPCKLSPLDKFSVMISSLFYTYCIFISHRRFPICLPSAWLHLAWWRYFLGDTLGRNSHTVSGA